MGCRCTKESVNIENKKFYILKKIADGYFIIFEYIIVYEILENSVSEGSELLIWLKRVNREKVML